VRPEPFTLNGGNGSGVMVDCLKHPLPGRSLVCYHLARMVAAHLKVFGSIP